MGIRNRHLLLASILCIANRQGAFAGGDHGNRQNVLEGSWWRAVGGPQEWSGTFVNLDDMNPAPLAFFGTTRISDGLSTAVRTGVDSYRMTTITEHGDDDLASPQRGPVWALIATGTLIQDRPGQFFGDALWDPFADPGRICGGTPRVEYRRVPLADRCE